MVASGVKVWSPTGRQKAKCWFLGSTRIILGKEMDQDDPRHSHDDYMQVAYILHGSVVGPLTKSGRDSWTNSKRQSSLAFFPVGINARETVCILLMCITRASYYYS